MTHDQLLVADCLPILATLPDLSVDCMISDPPYPNGSGYFTDSLIDGIAALYLAAKKTKKHIVFFWTPVVDPPQPPPGWFHTATHIWDKPDCKTSITYEQIIVWSRDYKRQPYRIWRVPILSYRSLKDWKMHPTQKPLPLLFRLVELYSQEGDLILDPFAGTGTTAVAAKHLRRHYLAIENNPEYGGFAKDRLAMREPPATTTVEEPAPPKTTPVKKAKSR